MTRPGDAEYAARLGASYVGVIFAESPRRVNEGTARSVFDAAGKSVGHVAVFSGDDGAAIAAIARASGAGIVQVHGNPTQAVIEAIRKEFAGEIWAVVPVAPDATALPGSIVELAEAADALLIDARVPGKAGGTGRTLNWARLADHMGSVPQPTSIILAGGLTPENVGVAIDAMHPSAVDVSSGVEISPGVKDLLRMKAFAEAVRSASIVGRTSSPLSGSGVHDDDT
jgi:phosphoribosylanthranilate isomerase